LKRSFYFLQNNIKSIAIFYSFLIGGVTQKAMKIMDTLFFIEFIIDFDKDIIGVSDGDKFTN